MKKNRLSLAAILLILFEAMLSSCEAIGQIFKAGMWFGIIGVVVVLVIIFWLINKVRRK